MKDSDILQSAKSGKPAFIGKYLLTKSGLVPYFDRKTGKPATFPQIQHKVQISDDVVAVNEYNVTAESAVSYKCPWKEGQKVVAVVGPGDVDGGNVAYRGELHPYEA